jgi:hypothetical protein
MAYHESLLHIHGALHKRVLRTTWARDGIVSTIILSPAIAGQSTVIGHLVWRTYWLHLVYYFTQRWVQCRWPRWWWIAGQIAKWKLVRSALIARCVCRQHWWIVRSMDEWTVSRLLSREQ